MKLAISNIGWVEENDEQIYGFMKRYGYSGLEIAPTRIFPNAPYEKLREAEKWAKKLEREQGFCVPSMQSIWYGRQEKIWGTKEERKILTGYTKMAIDFALALGCGNIVFGCPKNRCIPEGESWETAVAFFKELGDYAAAKGTVIGMEANPVINHTNFINDTASALKFIRQVDSRGFLLNLDVGTMLYNEEDISELKGNVKYINHVHISEPGLRPIEERALHGELFDRLTEEKYEKYVSIEMSKDGGLDQIEKSLKYVRNKASFASDLDIYKYRDILHVEKEMKQ